MAFLSMDQLRSRTWPTREAAVAELKRNGYKERGADYEVRQHSPDSWMVFRLDEIGGMDDAPPVKQQAAAAKSTRPAKMPAKITAKTAVAIAKSAKSGKMGAEAKALVEKIADETPTQRIAAAVTAKEATPTPATKLNGATVQTIPTGKKGKGKKAAATPPPLVELDQLAKGEPIEKAMKGAEVTPVKPDTEDEFFNDMTAPSKSDGPYTLRIGGLTDFGVPDQALAVSKRFPNYKVFIIDRFNKVVREIDGSVGAKKGERKGSGVPRAPRAPRDPNAGPSKILQAAIELAMRPGGVTRAQLKDVTPQLLPWTIMLKNAERFGYDYSTSAATDGKSRTVYHLKPTKK